MARETPANIELTFVERSNAFSALTKALPQTAPASRSMPMARKVSPLRAKAWAVRSVLLNISPASAATARTARPLSTTRMIITTAPPMVSHSRAG